jgi:alkylhydroperoxidase/carboxymuconolactone decarboxylase family protein YurZ
LIEALKTNAGRDAKTKQLVYIGIKSAQGDAKAVSFHVAAARELGASRGEIIDTILITLTVCGLNGVANCLPAALAVYDQK